MIRTEAITVSDPRHNRIRAPLAISLWLTPVFRPFATQTPSRRALPEFQASGSDGCLGARHVDPSCGGPKALERLLEILDHFTDWLGLRAHTLLSLGPQSKI
jgi:hypothetical protein